MISISTETICIACCAAVGTHYCGLAWCTHRICKPWLWTAAGEALREESDVTS